MSQTKVAYNRLKCEACGKKLVHLVVSKLSDRVDVKSVLQSVPKIVKYRADCPFCGDHSPVVNVAGSVSPIPEDNVRIIDVEMIDDKVFIRTSR